MRAVLGAAIVVAVHSISPGASATPISLVGPYHFLDNRSANDAGVLAGTILQFGVNSVSPNGGAGTSDPAIATQGSTTRQVAWLNQGVNSNFYSGGIADSAALRGSWSITFTNGPDTAVANTPTVSTSLSPLPFVNNVSVTGGGLTPTLSWTNTATDADAVAVRIRDNGINARAPGNPPTASVIFLEYLPSSTASFTIPNGVLANGRNYSIEIGQIDLRGAFIPGTGTAGGRIANMFVDTQNQSRAFFNYSPTDTGPAAVYLPTTTLLPSGLPSYSFNVANVGGRQIFIDPVLAVGYDYTIGDGDPLFRSVLLPDGIGDGSYTVVLPNGQSIIVAGGSEYSFTSHPSYASGVGSFRVLGIEESAGLSPFDPTAFITGLTFVGNGSFTGSMTPIVAFIPEPGTLALFVGCMGALGWVMRRRSPAVT